ncbi:hypothetical protein, partial [Serratia nevei]
SNTIICKNIPSNTPHIKLVFYLPENPLSIFQISLFLINNGCWRIAQSKRIWLQPHGRRHGVAAAAGDLDVLFFLFKNSLQEPEK